MRANVETPRGGRGENLRDRDLRDMFKAANEVHGRESGVLAGTPNAVANRLLTRAARKEGDALHEAGSSWFRGESDLARDDVERGFAERPPSAEAIVGAFGSVQ
jgi:hypothetical protein